MSMYNYAVYISYRLFLCNTYLNELFPTTSPVPTFAPFRTEVTKLYLFTATIRADSFIRSLVLRAFAVNC